MRNMYTGGDRIPRERRNTGGQGKRRGETEEKKDDVPGHFVSHREDVPLRMEMFAHAHLPKFNNSHYANVEREEGLPRGAVARDSRYAVALRDDRVRFQPLRFRLTLHFRWTRGRGRSR